MYEYLFMCVRVCVYVSGSGSVYVCVCAWGTMVRVNTLPDGNKMKLFYWWCPLRLSHSLLLIDISSSISLQNSIFRCSLKLYQQNVSWYDCSMKDFLWKTFCPLWKCITLKHAKSNMEEMLLCKESLNLSFNLCFSLIKVKVCLLIEDLNSRVVVTCVRVLCINFNWFWILLCHLFKVCRAQIHTIIITSLVKAE